MPHTNRKPPPAPARKPFEPAQFVNITLSPGQIAAIKASDWSMEHQDNGLNALLGQGYKITMRFEEKNDCFACWIIPPEKSENSGYILAGRGSTPTKCIKQALYIHFKMFEGIWGTEDLRKAATIDD